MANKRSPKKRRLVAKTVLRLPDLDQAKAAVLNSLSSRDAQRGYRHAIDEFIEWYCSGGTTLANTKLDHLPRTGGTQKPE